MMRGAHFPSGIPSLFRHCVCGGMTLRDPLRWSWCILLLLGLGTGSLSYAQSASAEGGDADTVYVATHKPVEVTYTARMDTVVVTAEAPSSSRRSDRRADRRTTAGSPASATGSETSTGRRSGISVGGFVLNETRSVIGVEFYNRFYDQWADPDGAANFTIRVREQPTPRLGTQVMVQVEEKTVFQARLRPQTRQIRRAAQQAVSRATLYLKKYYEPRRVY